MYIYIYITDSYGRPLYPATLGGEFFHPKLQFLGNYNHVWDTPIPTGNEIIQQSVTVTEKTNGIDGRLLGTTEKPPRSSYEVKICGKTSRLVGGLEHDFYDFPFSWECHVIPTDDSSIIFQRGRAQPPTSRCWPW